MVKYDMSFAAIFILVIFLLKEAFEYLVEYINLNYMKRHLNEIPQEFDGHVDKDIMIKTQSYVIENTVFGFASSLFNNIVLIIFIFGGLLSYFNSWVLSLNKSFIVSALIFFFVLIFVEFILSIPFNLYSVFKIESKFGFNTMTLKTWFFDLLKGTLVSAIIMSIIISTAFWLLGASPDWWWLWLWIFFFIFSVFIMYISPYIIEPLFNKFTQIDDDSIIGNIRDIMDKAGISISKVLKMDASKRSKHTNAYFTGIGKTKRIVLFDTLLEKMDKPEIVAVLAHEAGHWKKKHILKRILLYEILSFIILYVAYLILKSEALIHIFTIEQSSLYAKFILFAFLANIIMFPLAPVFNMYSQKHENEADRFSYEITKDSKSLVSSLIKLSKDNLSNIHPHPIYVKFHYSHPPVLERIRNINSLSTNK